MKFNDSQLRAITSEKALVLVSAGAGSGKTRVLTERFIHLCELQLKDPSHPVGATVEEIAAITFTEKAAREMKDRIRKRLAEKETEADDKRAQMYWQEQKEAIERAHISTFHSFCQRLLTQHAMKADLIPNSRVIDDVEARSRKRSILKTMLEEKEHHELALPLLQVMSKNQLFEYVEKVHDDIREFVVGEQAIMTLHVDEMLEKQKQAKLQAQVEIVKHFHENAVRCIEAFPLGGDLTKAQKSHVERITEGFQSITGSEEPTHYMSKVEPLMPSRSDKRWSEKVTSLYELFEGYWKPFKEKWKEIGGDGVVDEQTREITKRFVQLLKEFSRRYMYEKKIAGMLDFSDLQQKAVALLQHEAIKEVSQKQFRHMMVDEFQDTNRLQLEMLERIEPAFQFIVGDQKQSIYRFRGANVSLMNEREDLAHSLEDAEVILMNQNYRTQAPVIEAVNELFSYAMVSKRTHSYETVYAPLEAHRQSEQLNEKRVELTILENENEADCLHSYDVLANRLVEMIHTGFPRVNKDDRWVKPSWGDIAILIPARSHLLTLERALMNKGIPYVVSGGVGFYERQEIIDFVTFLRWLNRPFEELHLLAILRNPICGLTVDDFLTLKSEIGENEALYQLVYDQRHSSYNQLPTHIQKACQFVQKWLETWTPFRPKATLEATLDSIFNETGLRTALFLQQNGLQKVRNVEKLIQTIAGTNNKDLETILMELEERIALSEKEGESEVERVDGDVIQIMTVHASKGLEFPIVCLPQLERQNKGDKGSIRFHADFGIVLNVEMDLSEFEEDSIVHETPAFGIVKDRANAEAREEAKRLFYVAMTRARDYLYMIGEQSKASHTWLDMTQGALEQTNLSKNIVTNNEIIDQENVQDLQSIYTPPTKVEKNKVPISFSVSEVMLFIKDPIAYFNKHVIGIPEIILFNDEPRLYDKKYQVDASRLGSLVHRACELRDSGLPQEQALVQALREEELDGSLQYETQMQKLMQVYTDEVKEHLGETLINEWGFSTFIEGAEIIGEIDKVAIKNGKRHLIDFKTNHIKKSGSELLEFYWPQLVLYKIAYEQETKELIDELSLFVFRDEAAPLHSLESNTNQENKIRKAIRTMVTLREQQAPKSAYQELVSTFESL
ncbi:ATP-dependent helicase/nuclease subunit A [Halalkalibacter krulwichiae]|uniref:DNA 3'-5' helicase n=2 Tax=Halalkalibacter krulwichiae TaxID=199441 RepID=A0A1X9MIP9_9BACI|nr:UvrD-helicase domain-containing protein [Halalkalibacter krulwichiae]ARK31541.1 ATP-dependent helicase/nuclease subunit A [Halalkalibacter krulwichiae]